jgi:hypothetical protein
MYLVNPSSFQTARPRQQMPAQRQGQQQAAALGQIQQSGAYKNQGPNNFGFQQQPANPQANQGMQAASQVARQQGPNLGQAMAQMAAIHGLPQGQQQMPSMQQSAAAARAQMPQQMPQQMPSMQQSAMAARAQMPQQMPQQQATRVRIPRQNPRPF